MYASLGQPSVLVCCVVHGFVVLASPWLITGCVKSAVQSAQDLAAPASQQAAVPEVLCAATQASQSPASTAAHPAVRVHPADGSELVLIPAGPFTMGAENGEADERPVHTVNLEAYWIGRNLVTNLQFARFLNACGNKVEHGLPWFSPATQGRRGISCDDGHYRTGRRAGKRPVVGVSWWGARAYCAWAGLRLPTEAEFEKAARGTDARTWPWGETLREDWLTCLPAGAISPNAGNVPAPSPVGSHTQGASPYGCLDMAGNAWEWCSSLYATYPYRADDGREQPDREGPRVVRGGGFRHAAAHARTTNRYRVHWYYARGLDKHVALSTGFRVAATVEASSSSGSQATGQLSPPAGRPARMAHPPMALHAVPLTSRSESSDRRYRLQAGKEYPECTIVGYPVDEERERRYVVPLERLEDLIVEDRDATTQPARVLQPLHLRSGGVVADIGAGSGYFTRGLCQMVGERGEVWATDISVASLRFIQRRIREEASWPHVGCLRLVLHDCTDCLLPARHFDAVLMSQAHYFVYPRARPGASPQHAQVQSFYRSVARSLKPGGLLAIHEDSERHRDQDPERGPLRGTEIIGQLRKAGLVLRSQALLTSSSLVLKARGQEMSRYLLLFSPASEVCR